MMLFSVVCRLYDALPLVADGECDPWLPEDLRKDAVALCRRLAADPRIPRDSPAMVLCDHPYVFYVLAHSGLACVAICDTSVAPTAAFAFLDGVHSEFGQQYGARVDFATRPYSFLSFDACLQNTKRLYLQSGSVAKAMSTRMAAFPPPRRVSIEEMLDTSSPSRPSRRGSETRRTSPTSRNSSASHSTIVLAPLEHEFDFATGGKLTIWAESVLLARENSRLIISLSFLTMMIIAGLYFLIAYLFE